MITPQQREALEIHANAESPDPMESGIAEALREIEDLAELEDAVSTLRTEVNCRIEHGAESGGHLEYVQSRLDKIMGRQKT